MKPSPDRTNSRSGQALIEFALVLPLLFLLIVNVVNFGAFLFAVITVADAARTGADYMLMGGATVDAPPLPNPATQVEPVVRKALSSLPAGATAIINVCTNNSTDPSNLDLITCTGGSLAIPRDPDYAVHVSGAVDITYSYTPLIPLWEFPALHIHATLPPISIHRRATVRMEL